MGETFTRTGAHTPPTDEARAGFDPLELRHAFGQFPQGVVAVAAETSGSVEGFLASTFTVGVSLEPALVTFAIQHSSTTWPKLRDGGTHLGVSVIGRGQRHISGKIASKDRAQRFTDVPHTVNDRGAVILHGSPLWLHTRIYHQFTAGDHDVVVLEVLDFGVNEGAQALVFHRSEFKEISPVMVSV